MLSEKEKSEVENLKQDPLVKLAQRALIQKVDPEKKRLYQLRWLRKQGEKMVKAARSYATSGELQIEQTEGNQS